MDDTEKLTESLIDLHQIYSDDNGPTSKFLNIVVKMWENYYELDVPLSKTLESHKFDFNQFSPAYQKFLLTQNDPVNLLPATMLFLQSRTDLDPIPEKKYYYIVRIRNNMGLDLLPNIKLFDNYEKASLYIKTIVPDYQLNQSCWIAGRKLPNNQVLEIQKINLS